MIDYDNFTYEIIAIDTGLLYKKFSSIRSIPPSITMRYEYEGNEYDIGLVEGKFYSTSHTHSDASVIGCAIAVVTKYGGTIMVDK